jgi:aspartyl-tRNA(Asn)/glutamyl-tRNA(Gln) amidotransferase subunit B
VSRRHAATEALDLYEPIIGLEIHVQLLTASKLFCRCSTRFGDEPNANTCPVCLGLPGVLPVLNRRAVELATRLSLSLDCNVGHESVFARKNYFYPDLAKGYQISQYDRPLATGGVIRFTSGDGVEHAVRLTRIHLEEDAGKLVHAGGDGPHSLVDFNRAGVPLVEIVSEPDLRSPGDAHAYLQKLRQLVRWLGVSDGNMEEGSLRCDANVSLRPRGSTVLGTKTEFKNLHSFLNVERALAFEIERQFELLARGAEVGQHTLLWDTEAEVSRPMRSKEEAHDYRYFPEPDLLPLRLAPAWIDELAAAVPELPDTRERRYVEELGLPRSDARVLAGSRELSDYFEATQHHHRHPKQVANWIMTEVMAVLNERQIEITEFPIAPPALAELLGLIAAGDLSGKLAKLVFRDMLESGRAARAVIAERGLQQIDDAAAIREHARAVVDAHPEQLEQYLAGKQTVLQFFMGQLMRRTRGQVNPGRGRQLLTEELERRRSARS